MQKFGILFIVLCAVIVASSVPVKKHHGHRKSAKIVRFTPKTAKTVRNSAKLVALPMKPLKHRRASKLQLHAHGNSEASFIDDTVEQLYPENDQEAQFFDAEAGFEQDFPEQDEYPVERALDEEEVEEEMEEEMEEEELARSAAAEAGSNSYFGVNFGKTHGGAIGIANSYSTGKSGTAASTSTAYGTASAPAQHQARYRAAKLRAAKPKRH